MNVVQWVAPLGAAVVALALGLGHWRFGVFVALTVFAVCSDLMAVDADGGGNIRITGSFLGIVVAAVLLGGGPAAAIGALTNVAGWLRWREAPHYFRNNMTNFTWFALLAGLFFRFTTRTLHADPSTLDYYLLVFATFLFALVVNFFLSAGYRCYIERTSLRDTAVQVFLPLLAAELFSALLTLAAVYLTLRLGTAGLAMFGLVLVIFQYLLRELLTSKHRSEKLQRMVTTDELTGLANRERFREVVEERIAAARQWNSNFTVMLMDLDRFKEINDTLGHHYGDVLLQDMGPRLVEAVGTAGLVARLGGDEFGILPAPGAHDIRFIEREVERLIKRISEPFSVDELSLEVGASIGVARFPEDGADSHALLRCADIAMYSAKEAQSDFKVYTAEQNQHSVRRLSVLSDMRHALASDEIVVHYQPIVDLNDLSVTGAEGLVRWQHPEHGLIPPGAFVQTVEQTGLIGPLTRHVLERSIAECASWRKGGRELSVAVNLSVRNLLDRDLPKEIERLLATYSLPPGALQLEITESMIMSDPDRAVATVTRLSTLGVRMSVDDFGTGYSSLDNLRKLPIDELKIDRSFVSPMLRDESDLIIVRSTINLGHDLGLKIIAEGVEDGATLQHLALLGCDLAQGYHLSRPIPADEFEAWLRNATPDSVSNGTTEIAPAPARPRPAIELPAGVARPPAFKATV
ncbi:MAG: putative bifunctional diguanylate cyclase/phosphodiesterase [Solirubrobacteraceae bacterium]